jgi:uncharacterized protein YbbC (DUF1343 family)
VRVATGLDVLVSDRLDLLRGRRVGVLCHPASVTSDLIHVVDRLIAAGVRPARLFGPEHGVRGEAQDMVGVDDGRDTRTGIPVTSLYGETFESLTPTATELEGLDVLVIDLQDVGSRYYTYVWTMALALGAAARSQVAVVVLDRPNPLGGVAIEGGTVQERCASFVGLGAVPVRHGLTIGEVARLVAAGMPWGAARFARPLDCDLTVVAARGWRRSMVFAETGLPWVMPSPNMPTLDTAIVYPGTVLFEGTNVSEGRGTTRPFELTGAPWVTDERFADALNARRVPGVHFRATVFEPTFHKHAKATCGGVQIHVTDRGSFAPVLAGILLTEAFRAADPSRFEWRQPPYEYEYTLLPFDILCGTSETREQIEAGVKAEEIARSWQSSVAEFERLRERFLLY